MLPLTAMPFHTTGRESGAEASVTHDKGDGGEGGGGEAGSSEGGSGRHELSFISTQTSINPSAWTDLHESFGLQFCNAFGECALLHPGRSEPSKR